jgi:L-seryl-tRNA(Ser) seleniumtransferase
MTTPSASPLPALHALLDCDEAAVLKAQYGRSAVLDALRVVLASYRERRDFGIGPAKILAQASGALTRRFAASQRLVFNMTGTVLHTNLGRAQLPPEAANAVAAALRGATNLEYDLERGARGERDDHIAGLIRELTGAAGATVVNNNAAAVLLVLNTFARDREVIVSRGELVEIGGSFRIPDIISRSGAILREVGTTNRTHARDYQNAITPTTAALMRVHQSNFAIVGFTASVPTATLAEIAHGAGLPLIEDLGSGTLIDLERWGLPHETTPADVLRANTDLVTFSGDKLLGGPQAGIIAGGAELIRQINANPLKRALRLDKGLLAGLEAVLRLYLAPELLPRRLPTLSLLTRPAGEIQATAERIAAGLRAAWPDREITLETCNSQIGSGTLPVDLLPSTAVVIGGDSPDRLSRELRALPRPVIGRVHDGRLWLDCRCLVPADEAEFLSQLSGVGQA